MNEIEAISLLIEQNHFIYNEYEIVTVYKDGKHGGEYSYIVHWCVSSNHEDEKSFETATEAATFYIEKCKELK